MAYWQNKKGENRQIDIKAHYYDLLEEFEKDYPEKTEYDFIKNEIDFYGPHIKELEDTPTDESFTDEAKRLDLIEKKRYYNFFRDKLDAYNARVKPEEPINDFSDALGTEKIVMLQQLGILDYLKSKQPFIQSTNKLAEVISGFTGEKTSTIQSYINPMNNPTTSQKNNPMTKRKIVSKVNQKLISIGFNPPK